MPKLILSLDGILVKEVQLGQSRAAIGRRTHNDIIIDNLAVSGEHALIERIDNQMVLKDLDSTNGTYVNGQSIRQQVLAHNDQIEIGRYKIQYLEDANPPASGALDKPAAESIGPPATPAQALPPTLDGDAIEGPRVRVLNGPSAGKSMALTKVVTTIGKPGVSVASITLRGRGYNLAHVTGDQIALVNGVSVADGPITLSHLDRITVGDVQLEFFEH